MLQLNGLLGNATIKMITMEYCNQKDRQEVPQSEELTIMTIKKTAESATIKRTKIPPSKVQSGNATIKIITSECHNSKYYRSATVKRTVRKCYKQRTASECYNQNDCQGRPQYKYRKVPESKGMHGSATIKRPAKKYHNQKNCQGVLQSNGLTGKTIIKGLQGIATFKMIAGAVLLSKSLQRCVIIKRTLRKYHNQTDCQEELLSKWLTGSATIKGTAGKYHDQ